MSSSCLGDQMTSEGGLILTSVSTTLDGGDSGHDAGEKSQKACVQLQASSELKSESVSALGKTLWPASIGPLTPLLALDSTLDGHPTPMDQSPSTTAHTPKPVNMATSGSGLMCRPEDKGRLERKRRPSNDSHDSSTKASEGAADDTRDDDDDNDDDDDETKLQSQDIDPERLKAFNLFVRLFIDENLDRSIPISKQPKDKIQAILEACDRQFSEFHDRARKRIRTYLKSCRRLRRSKEGAIDQIRPTPPHLTSAIAEGILAMACENESNNAKRMRMGLEPLPAAVAAAAIAATQSQHLTVSGHVPLKSLTSSALQLSSVGVPGLPPLPSHRSPFLYPKLGRASPSTQTQGLLIPPLPSDQTPTEKSQRGSHPLVSPAPHMNCYEAPSLCYPPLPTTAPTTRTPAAAYPAGAYQRPAHYHHHHPTNNGNNGQMQNGPTDLSLKSTNAASSSTSSLSSSSSSSSSNKNSSLGNSNSQLNNSEMATIRQLISGYRESAAFLYRSADELEQLLIIHHK